MTTKIVITSPEDTLTTTHPTTSVLPHTLLQAYYHAPYYRGYYHAPYYRGYYHTPYYRGYYHTPYYRSNTTHPTTGVLY